MKIVMMLTHLDYAVKENENCSDNLQHMRHWSLIKNIFFQLYFEIVLRFE